MTDTHLKDLTRPILGIENRTAQEVFDLMSDRDALAAEVERLRDALRECEGALDLHGKMYPAMVKGYTLDALNAARTALKGSD